MLGLLVITGELLDIYDVKYGQNNFDGTRDVTEVARFGCIGCPAIEATEHAPASSIKKHGTDSPLNELYAVMFEARKHRNRAVRYNPRKQRWGKENER